MSIRGDATHPWERLYPDGIDWRQNIPSAPATTILDEAVERFGGQPCADFMDRQWRFEEVGRLTDRFARGLQSIGVRKGVRVGLFLPNCPYYLIAYYAVLKCGGVVVNFNPLYVEREIRNQILDSGAEIMVTLDLDTLFRKLEPMASQTPLRHVILCSMAKLLPWPRRWLYPLVRRRDMARPPRTPRYLTFAQLTRDPPAFNPVAIDPNDVAVLQYTGGTTGAPKGAMLTHANITANAAQSRAWFASAREGEEVMLAVLPFFHAFAMTVVMNLSLRLGACMVMLPRFDIHDLMKTIDRKKPTLFPAVPTIYAAINNYSKLAKYDVSSIRLCISGGDTLPPAIKERFERLTGCTLIEGYGLTEASPVTHANPLEGLNKPASIGLPLPGTVPEIVSLKDRRTLLPAGEHGELCIRGPQVMKGYWNRPDESESYLVDGRLHTGDVGYMDEDGYVFIVDRIKDLILAGGYNVYPRNVEEAINEHPAVEEVAVVGVPDRLRGQRVKAFVKLKEGERLTSAELFEFLDDKLSPIEKPRQVEFRESLPRTLVGKLDRKALMPD